MNNDKYEKVVESLLNKKDLLSYNTEDSKLLIKLWDTYWKKRKGKANSSPEVLAAAVLWVYSSSNFLWEANKKWTQNSLSELFGVRGKTIGENSRQIRRLLKINIFDNRFCRKDVTERNPLNQFGVSLNGMIIPKDMAIERGLPFISLKKSKEDYYFDGMDCLDAGELKKAVYYFKKAIEIDDEFVDAYNGMGTVYWWDNSKKAKEFYEKGYELTQKHFNYKWPKELPWGIQENRQYLRAIQYYGLALWREENNDKALELFKLLLNLNKSDNQGARYLVASLYAGLKWEEIDEEDRNKEEKILEEQNKKHNFWKYEE